MMVRGSGMDTTSPVQIKEWKHNFLLQYETRLLYQLIKYIQKLKMVDTGCRYNRGLCKNFMNFSNGFNIVTSASETKNATMKLKPAILVDTNNPQTLPK